MRDESKKSNDLTVKDICPFCLGYGFMSEPKQKELFELLELGKKTKITRKMAQLKEPDQKFTFNETLAFFTDADHKLHPESSKEAFRRFLKQERENLDKQEETIMRYSIKIEVFDDLLKRIEQ